MTINDLMQLIAKLNRWGDQSSSVAIGRMERRVYTDEDSSHIVRGDWGWVVSTTICGLPDKSNSVGAQAATLEGALLALAHKIVDHFDRLERSYGELRTAAIRDLQAFITTHKDTPLR